MQTELECLICFMQQALSTSRLSTDDSTLHRQIIHETGRLLSSLHMSASPPENAVQVYSLIAELSSEPDPFKELKKESNSFALQMREKIHAQICNAEDSLYTAVRYSIAGNIIDYGAQHEFDAMQTLSKCIEEELCIDDFEGLGEELRGQGPRNILYLADNCGEIVFDGLLVEQLLRLGHRVTMVVRGENILNDATLQEAEDTGVASLCNVITNGSSCPGVPLASCTDELREAFGKADLILSKGQGNFETLSEVNGPIYFLLTVKCNVVAKHISTLKALVSKRVRGKGEMILMKQEEKNARTTD